MARNYVDDIMPNIEKNFIWTKESFTTDLGKLSFIDLLGLDYQYFETFNFLRNVTLVLQQYDYENFKDKLLKAKIKSLILKDHNILPENEKNEMDDLISELVRVKEDVRMCYACKIELCDLTFDYLNEYLFLMLEDDQICYWSEWRKKAGTIRKGKLRRYLELFRKASKLNEDGCETSVINLFSSLLVRMCNRLTLTNFVIFHSEFIELQLSESLSHLELILRARLWDGYRIILKDTIKLSILSTFYLRKVGVENSTEVSFQSKINRLYRESLKLIPLLNAFIEGKVFVDLLDEKINFDVANCELWNLKAEYLGTQPPLIRTNDDFDFLATKFDHSNCKSLEGLLYRINYDDWVIVLSKIFAFQLYEGLCNKTRGNFTDLNECDFSGSKEVGLALKDAMQWGNVKPWPEHFKEILGNTDISAIPILNYFKPLQNWLEDFNNQTNIFVGWKKVDRCA